MSVRLAARGRTTRQALAAFACATALCATFDGSNTTPVGPWRSLPVGGGAALLVTTARVLHGLGGIG